MNNDSEFNDSLDDDEDPEMKAKVDELI